MVLEEYIKINLRLEKGLLTRSRNELKVVSLDTKINDMTRLGAEGDDGVNRSVRADPFRWWEPGSVVGLINLNHESNDSKFGS